MPGASNQILNAVRAYIRTYRGLGVFGLVLLQEEKAQSVKEGLGFGSLGA